MHACVSRSSPLPCRQPLFPHPHGAGPLRSAVRRLQQHSGLYAPLARHACMHAWLHLPVWLQGYVKELFEADTKFLVFAHHKVCACVAGRGRGNTELPATLPAVCEAWRPFYSARVDVDVHSARVLYRFGLRAYCLCTAIRLPPCLPACLFRTC